MIFDLLWLDGQSLMARPYTERREALAALSLRGERWHTPDYIAGHGRETLAASERQGLEGVIAKRLDSPYEPGRRSGAWIKLKNVRRERLAVGGWLAGQGRRRDGSGRCFSASGSATGRFATPAGLAAAWARRSSRRSRRLSRPWSAPTPRSLPGGAAKPPRGANFVEPALEVEVAFREWTEDGVLRQPSFKKLLTQPAPVDAAIEIGPATAGGRSAARVDGRELVLSNLDKVLYPRTASPRGR